MNTHLANSDHGVQNALLDINWEGDLLKETKDILDELHILTRIKAQQQAVAEAFVKNIRKILLPKAALIRRFKNSMPLNESLMSPGIWGTMGEDQIDSAMWTLEKAEALLKGIQDRIHELNTLQEAARNTSSAVSIIPYILWISLISPS